MVQKNKRIKVIHIDLFLPFIHDCHAMRRERKSEGWDELSNLQESGPNKMAEGKKAYSIKFLRLPDLSCKATAMAFCYGQNLQNTFIQY